MFGIIISGIVFFFKIFRLLNPSLLKSRGIRETFPEEETYESGFAAHYDQYLKDKVLTFEKERLLALKKSRRNLFIMFIRVFLVDYILIIPSHFLKISMLG